VRITSGSALGGIDYVTKPFRYAVLMARLNAHLRVHRSSEAAVYSIGPYTFRPGDKTLLEGDKRIRLTEKETHVLKFPQRAGKMVERGHCHVNASDYLNSSLGGRGACAK